jgi:hypothetical protein
VSNHAHRRDLEPFREDPYRHGFVPGVLQFFKECFSPATGKDRFPKRGTATRRMNRAIKRGYFGKR